MAEIKKYLGNPQFIYAPTESISNGLVLLCINNNLSYTDDLFFVKQFFPNCYDIINNTTLHKGFSYIIQADEKLDIGFLCVGDKKTYTNKSVTTITDLFLGDYKHLEEALSDLWYKIQRQTIKRNYKYSHSNNIYLPYLTGIDTGSLYFKSSPTLAKTWYNIMSRVIYYYPNITIALSEVK